MKTAAVIDALGALAHEHRLAIYRLLVEQGPAGLPAGVIGERRFVSKMGAFIPISAEGGVQITRDPGTIAVDMFRVDDAFDLLDRGCTRVPYGLGMVFT